MAPIGVHTASGAGMRINQIGQSFVHIPKRNLVLNNVLYVPEANLASVHHLISDNNVFIEFHPNYFLINNRAMKKTLLRGNCEGGLYPLKSRSSPNKVTCGTIKSSSARSHSHLGHPSFAVVDQVLRKNNIPFVPESNKEALCDAYHSSTCVSSSLLGLVFSDVWGPASTFVGKTIFYISFNDDFSKFTWIYLLCHKYEVFQCFHDFQHMVERQFDKKVLAIQTNWG